MGPKAQPVLGQQPKFDFDSYDLTIDEKQVLDQVAECLTRATEAIPNSAETYRSLGAVYDFKLSKPKEALEAYARFLELGGKDPDVDARVRALGGQTGAVSSN